MHLSPKPDDRQKTAFYDGFFREFAKVPFGSMSKRDLECLLLQQLLENRLLPDGSNRALANALGINETRLKNYLVDIRYKYGGDHRDANIRALIRDLFAAERLKVVHENQSFLFALEDPVKKLDFEQAMKDVGYFTDTSFNKEIVKVRDYALLAFLFRFHYSDETYSQFAALMETTQGREKDLLRVLGEQETWLDRGKKLMALADQGFSALDLLKKAAVLVTTGTF